MVIENQLEVLNQISDIAASAGVANQIDKEFRRLVMVFTLEPGRTHLVYVYPSEKALAGRPTVTVSSPCTIFKNGSASGALKEKGLEPFFADEYQPYASYEVIECTCTNHSVVVASLVHDVENLGEVELLQSLACVALAAERYEEKFGTHDA